MYQEFSAPEVEILDADSQIGAAAEFPKAGVHDCFARSPFPAPWNVPKKSVNHFCWKQNLESAKMVYGFLWNIPRGWKG